MIHRLVILIQKSPGNQEIKGTTDYTDWEIGGMGGWGIGEMGSCPSAKNSQPQP